jgi:hypothetical protein
VQYAMTARTRATFAEASTRIRKALQAQGFGVLTEIDVESTLREKLGEQMEQYVILGACNPQLAHRALSADRLNSPTSRRTPPPGSGRRWRHCRRNANPWVPRPTRQGPG